MSYDQDFYAWTFHNATLLRQHRWQELDIDKIAEELESMGRSEKRELGHRLALLLMHLLKWQFQPNRQSHSWLYTIKDQRRAIRRLLKDSPSLQHQLDLIFNEAYEDSILMAVKETGMKESAFPVAVPYTLEQALDDEFYPQ